MILSRLDLMVVRSNKSLNLVNSNPGTYLPRQREKVIHFIQITRNTRISTPFTQTVSPFRIRFSPQFHLLLNCSLRQSPLFSAILVFFFVILELFLVFVYHRKQILILKLTIPFRGKETSDYMT